MKAEVISIGDELLIGQTVNSNASFLAEGLTRLGIESKWIVTVGDNRSDLLAALATAMQRSDLVIVTGGLGPTHDDITKNVAAEFFESGFTFHPEILDEIRHRFKQRGIEPAANNAEQAQVPDKATIIPNPIGTAPGLIFEQDEAKCIILPGVPGEMKAMCEQTVFQMFSGLGKVIVFKTLRTTGLPESTLFERMGDISEVEQFAKVAFLPKAAGVDVRLTATGTDKTACQQNIEKAIRLFEDRVGKYIYAHDDKAIEQIVAQQLLATGKTIAVAESCTGGLLAHKLTNIPGSSGYFERGVVTYSNEAKMELLAVPKEILQRHGAVSEQTAKAMASGVRRLAETDFGLSTTGIAGPSGGTPEKPVGLVFIGIAQGEESIARRFVFTKDRLRNKERTVQATLDILRTELSR